MPFDFAEPRPPMTVRACRALVWTQAGLTILGGLFVLLTATLLAGSSAILVHGGTLSGGAAAALGGVSVMAGSALVWLGAALGRQPWAVAALAALEAFLAALTVFRAFDVSAGTLLNAALCIAVVALLAAPDSRRAASRGPAA